MRHPSSIGRASAPLRLYGRRVVLRPLTPTDFDEWSEPLPKIHYCFRVSSEEFDSILGRIRAAGIPYRSAVHGPVDNQVDDTHGGRIVYWNVPDGHQWEMLTESYARKA